MINPKRDASLLALGADSEGMVDLGECRAAGMTDDKLNWLVRSGRWQNPLPRACSDR
jgi:hypothetical protein